MLDLIEQVKAKLRVKGISHPSMEEIFEYALKKSLGIKQPKKSTSPGGVKVKRPHIPAALKREVRRKAGDQCTYTFQGRRCSQKHGLQTEHIIPYGKGGPTTLENLTLLCPQHNRLRAIEEYGPEKMQKYLGVPVHLSKT